MRYITKEEFESLPSYPWVEEAIYHSSTPEWEQEHGGGRHNMPFTKNGLVAVQALWNLSRWENWKSSSLSREERDVAGSIGGLKLGHLMELNKGRRMNQPALFPEGDLLSEGR